MQQDRLNNQTEQAQLDMDTQRKQRTFEQNKRLYGEKLIAKRITCSRRRTTSFLPRNARL